LAAAQPFEAWRIGPGDGRCISGFNGDAEYSPVDPAHKAPYIAALRQSIAAAKAMAPTA
jgi:hydroxypyruvate isomerase